MTKINLETLGETVRVEILKLAAESLDSNNSQFVLDGSYYTVTRNDAGVMEIYERTSPKSVMRGWSRAQSKEFGDKVKIGKESSNPEDRKFEVGGIYTQIVEPTTGNFNIVVSLMQMPTPALPVQP